MGAAASPALAQPVRIDRVDPSKYKEQGFIRFYVDVTNPNGAAVKPSEVDANGVKVLADEKPAPGSSQVTAFEDTTEAVSIAIIIAAHNDWMPIKDDDDESFGLEVPIDMAIAGMFSFVQGLRPVDRVSLWCYSEVFDFRQLSGFKNAGSATADEFRGLAVNSCRREKKMTEEKEEEGQDSVSAPRLFSGLRGAVQDGDLGKSLREEKGRKIVFMMSDGMDVEGKRGTTGEAQVGQHLAAIAEASQGLDTQFYTLGFDTLNGEFFRYLSRLSADTGGVHIPLSPEQSTGGDVQAAWKNMAVRILNQFIIVFTPVDLEGGKKVRFGLEISAGGAVYTGSAPAPVMIPERNTNWGEIVKWVGIGLGGLFLVVLLFVLILKRIQNPRPKEIVVHQEVQNEMSGPARGKLLATKGPRAGEVFYLTEEVTTIGRLEGNHIVIDDPSVSKRHAGIRVKDLRFELADLGAANGVLVNGRQITKQFLRDGDQIRVGDTELTFHLK
jgi:hypothetical protein